MIGALPHSQAENGPNALQWIHCDKTVSSLSKTNTIAVSPFQRLFLFSDDATFEYKKSMNMVLNFNPKQYPLPSKKNNNKQKSKKTLSSFCKSPKQVCLAYTSLPLFWVSSHPLLSCTSGIESSYLGSSHGLPSHLFLLSISFAQISLCQLKYLNMKLLLPNQLISLWISFFFSFFVWIKES